MNIKTLIGIVHRPWFIEPYAAQQWAEAAKYAIKTGSMPSGDKRTDYSDPFGTDYRPVYRVNNEGMLDRNGAIQVFRIISPIAKYDYCGDPGSQTWMQLLEAANADSTIQSIILWIDSPGGQVDGTHALANALKQSAKPVITYSDGLLCSAAYWFACSTSLIVVDGSNDGWNATIGSIGTMCAWEDDSIKKEKEGVKLITVFADDSSDKWGDYFARMEGDYTNLKAQLNGLNASFLDSVKANRAGKLSLKKENVLSGKTYNANEALDYGLVDKIGTFMDAVNAANSFYKKSQTKSKKMTTTALAFGAVLIAAKAQAFQVVEGGFLLTEEQLNNIEAKMDHDQVTAVATTGQLKQLQSQSEQFGTAAKTASDLIAANAKVTELTTSLATANAKITELEKGAGATFATVTTQADPGADAPGKPKVLDSFEQMAATLMP